MNLIQTKRFIFSINPKYNPKKKNFFGIFEIFEKENKKKGFRIPKDLIQRE